MRSERVTVETPVGSRPGAGMALRRGGRRGDASFSAYVAEAVSARRLRERALAALTDLYGGPPPPDELARARRMLRLAPPPAAV